MRRTSGARASPRASDLRTREYWTGLFAHGFGLCGTTHAQWVAEMEALLGHNRGRGVGVEGHNSFEVFLTGGPYGDGKWVLLDHDISTVIYNSRGHAPCCRSPRSSADWKRLTDRKFIPEKQHGWLVCGLHPDDGGVYQQLRRGRIPGRLQRAAADGPSPPRRDAAPLSRSPAWRTARPSSSGAATTKPAASPVPSVPQTWVNQPEKMYNSRNGTGYKPGQARYGNAVYAYKPDFTSKDYREGVVEEDDQHVVFEFYTPYIIAATPANDKPWGIYDSGLPQRPGAARQGGVRRRSSRSTKARPGRTAASSPTAWT